VQDRHLARDAMAVAAFEAACRHPGCGAVAEVVRAPEAKTRGVTMTGRIEGRHHEGSALEVVRRVEADLRVQVAPIGWRYAERTLPLARELLFPMELWRRRLLEVDDLHLALDALVVQALEQPAYSVGCNSAAETKCREPNRPAEPPRIRGREQGRRPVDARFVGDGELEPELRPLVLDSTLDLFVLIGESQEREHKLTLVAKVEQKGTLAKSDLRDFFREMLLIRRFEEKVEERFRAGELPGFLHVAIGQEAVAVGVCRALEEGDIIASTHRAHGHTLAKGTTPNEVMAELYGKLEGCSHGYGGSMHLYDLERGNMGANAVVGGGLPGIVGSALAFKFRGEPRVAIAFFGDGATNIGTFHEALNLAQLWQVPAVFVCENNHWAESTPGKEHMPIEDISQRAVAFGMKAVKVDGQDVEAVYKATRRALEHARGEKGPVFLAVNTYRLVGHYIGDPQVYRSKEELEETRRTQDPIEHLRAKLDLPEDEVEEIDREVQEIVEASVEFAKNGTDPKPEDALKNVYA
jgi:acetoin:2,6-dichlorophenolindophenol oxidoreductase subunit alpha